jgi:hypothetical protein
MTLRELHPSIRIDRLEILANHLEVLESLGENERGNEYWKFDEWGPMNEKYRCGTAGCAAGELPFLFPGIGRKIEDIPHYTYHVLGINHELFSLIFTGTPIEAIPERRAIITDEKLIKLWRWHQGDDGIDIKGNPYIDYIPRYRGLELTWYPMLSKEVKPIHVAKRIRELLSFEGFQAEENSTL